MVASACCFGSMAIMIRLASRQLHPFEIAFFRNVFGLLFTLPLLARAGPQLLRTRRLPLYLLRCVLGTISMLAAFWAIVHLPLAQAIALSYSTPLFVTIGAIFVLGEIVRARRWTAVFVGFIGVLLIVRPGLHGYSPAALIALLAALMSACVSICLKFLSRTEAPDTVVIWTTLLWVPLSLPAALLYWQWPQPEIWAFVVAAGFFGTSGHMCWMRALKIGDVSLLAPISFVQMPIVAVLAYFMFGEKLDRWTALGAAVIFAANAYITHREARLSRTRMHEARAVAGGAES
ncbi:MAG TPA: DMT family transporter [Rhodanobacteraceae bacterium]|nr:DMT family transporter [Rhodanobacteraceae bacterium]